jgi:hypothetical protein
VDVVEQQIEGALRRVATRSRRCGGDGRLLWIGGIRVDVELQAHGIPGGVRDGDVTAGRVGHRSPHDRASVGAAASAGSF